MPGPPASPPQGEAKRSPSAFFTKKPTCERTLIPRVAATQDLNPVKLLPYFNPILPDGPQTALFGQFAADVFL